MTSPVSRHGFAAGKPLAIAIAIAISSIATAAFAQATGGKTLQPVVVTAARMPQIASEVLSDNIVISSEEIAKSGSRTLADLLQRQRGIEVTRNGGAGTQSSVFVRGTDNRQNVVLVDGVRVGTSTTGGATWAAIPLSQIDHVEIVYGPLSTMYGADAVGGVIQIFTKKGEGAPAPTASVGVGSYATRSAEAGISGAGGGVRYAIRSAYETSDGFSASKPGAGPYSYNPDRDGYTSKSASGRLGLDLAKGHEIGATFLYSRLDSQFDAGPSMDDRSRQKLATYSLYSKNRILPNWNSHVQLSQSDDRGASDASYGSDFYETQQRQLSWVNTFTVNKRDVLQIIAEHREEEVDSSNVPLAGSRRTNSLAASYQLHRGHHLAVLSLRNDDNSQFGSYTTGAVSYGYRFTGALRASASYGTSFRAPTFNELYYPQYGIASNKPERGRNAEAGLYYEDGATQYSAVYYRNRLTDLLVNTAVCPIEQASHRFGCAYNVNEALISGVSLGASRPLANHLTARASLDIQDPQDETTGRQLARRARKHGTLALDYAAGKVGGGGEVVFAGPRFDDAANTRRLGGYGILNLYANYEFAPNWSLFGRWNNVFDKNYELVHNYNTAGSNVFVGVRYGMR